jgi:hypothetical protein
VLLVRLCNLVSVLTSGESPDIDAVDYLRFVAFNYVSLRLFLVDPVRSTPMLVYCWDL